MTDVGVPIKGANSDAVRAVILDALAAEYGANMGTFEDDRFHIGVSFADGEFVNVRIGGSA